MPEYRMLVVDLDGSALSSHHAIREDDVRAAHALMDAGIAVSIATGRLLPGTAWAARELGVQGSFAVMNGSERHDLASGLVARTTLAGGLRETLRVGLQDQALRPFLFCTETIHRDVRDRPYEGYMQTWSHDQTEHDGIYASSAFHDETLVAVGGLGDVAPVEAAAARFREVLPANISVRTFATFTGEHFVLVRDHTEDKGTALRALAADRGLSAEQVVCIGDWWNDVPMLRAAGCGCVMGGSDPEVSAFADRVLESRRGTGGAIAEVARRLFEV